MTARPEKKDSGPSASIAAIFQALSDVTKLVALLKQHPIDAKTLIDLIEYRVTVDRQQRQQAAANKRYAANKKARTFVIEMWHVQGYKFKTKILFAEAAARTADKKFMVKVNAQTILRDWLRGAGVSRSQLPVKNSIAYADGRFKRRKLTYKETNA